VLRAIRTELPTENLIYVADSGYAPYGERAADFVATRSTALTQFLVEQGVKAVVVACNTATSAAVGHLRARFDMPIVAIEPAVKLAASRTRSRIVGVLATTGTLAGPNVANLITSYGEDVEFLIQPCPGLADFVERGELDSAETRSLVKRYVRPLVDKGADILVLGCTHYPFVIHLIREVAGSAVDVIDPANAVARELRRRLETGGLLRTGNGDGSERFWTTGPAGEVSPIVSQLWGKPVEVGGL
jgi:glutamate racemase